jgi:N-acetylglutamate synthase-like GNAT family acetyltransferase
MIINIVEWGTPEYVALIQLRTEILRIPLGLEFSEEEIAAEWDQFHIAAYDDAYNLLGCLVLKKENDTTMKMRQVAVFEAYQSMGIGKLLVSYSEKYCKEHQIFTLELHARDTAIPFYEKLRYQKIGKKFYEVGILHAKMKKNII